MRKSQPIRMCVACRGRYPQKTLIRLREEGKEIIAFKGQGRSFYLCKRCIENEKKLKGLAKRFKQEYEPFFKLLRGLALEVDRCEKSHINEGVDR